MRIIIETNGHGQAEPTVQMSAVSEQMKQMDGGPPSEQLLQSLAQITTGLIAAGETKTTALPQAFGAGPGIDAGSPPEWLMQAIAGAVQKPTPALNGANDAGAAPA